MMPFNAYLYTIKINKVEERKVYVDAYHWHEVEEITGITRRQMRRGADNKTPWLTRKILMKGQTNGSIY
jgi:hypothetical protein